MQVITFDFFILIAGVIIIATLKSKYPSLFFLASKVNIFLPPEQQPEEQPRKRSKQKKREDAPMKIMEANLENLKEFPLYNEYEKLFMLTVLLLFHWTITLLIRNIEALPEFFRRSSSLPHYLTLLLLIYGFVYMWKIATHNGFKSLELQTGAVATLVVVAIYFLVQLLLDTQSKESLSQAAQSLNRHMTLMFLNSKVDLGEFSILIGVLLISALLIFVTIPSIMKYGSIYTKLLKQAYLEETEVDYPEQMKVAKAKVKLQSKREVKILNVQLTLGMALLVCWGIPPIREQIPDQIFLSALICIIILLSYISIVTFKEQVELTMHGAYLHIKNYLSAEQRTKELFQQTQKKVYSYIYLFWYHSYQLLFKLAVPLLLLILAFQSLGNSPAYQSIKHHYEISPAAGLPSIPVNLDISCGIIKDPILAIRHLYHCSRSLPVDQIKTTINGWDTSIRDSSLEGTLKKITEYGLIPIEFSRQFWSQVLWYYLLSKYLLTIFYIVFLRKTVLEI